jgi:hypothetical protein
MALWKPVITGIQDNRFIEIISGLEANSEVIIGPYQAVSRTLTNEDASRCKRRFRKRRRMTSQPLILAIETSTLSCSVALFRGEALLGEAQASE